MLKLFDYLDALMEEHNNRQWFFERKLNFFANDVMEILGIEDDTEMVLSFQRTFQACSSLNIPISKNFKKIYRFNGEYLLSDWKISPLACYLIIINCNPKYERVAKAQLYFAMHQVTHK